MRVMAPSDWHPEQALGVETAIAGLHHSALPLAGVRPDEGHLRPGAHADLAVLNVELDALLRADEGLADVRRT